MANTAKVNRAYAKCEKLDRDLATKCQSAVSRCHELEHRAKSFFIYMELDGKMKEFKDLTFDKCIGIPATLYRVYKSRIGRMEIYDTRRERYLDPEERAKLRPAPKTAAPEVKYDPEAKRELNGLMDDLMARGLDVYEEDDRPRPRNKFIGTETFSLSTELGRCYVSKEDAQKSLLDKARRFAQGKCPKDEQAARQTSPTKYRSCTKAGKRGHAARAQFECSKPK